MAEQPPGQNSTFEDRIRSMLISGRAGNDPVSTAGAPQTPVVRLPPPRQSTPAALPVATINHGRLPAVTDAYYEYDNNAVPRQLEQASPTVRQRPSQKQRKAQSQWQNGPSYALPNVHVQRQYSGQNPGYLPSQSPIDPNAFQRGEPAAGYHRQPPPTTHRPHFNPNFTQHFASDHMVGLRARQADYLDILASQEVPRVSMSEAEKVEKDAFRVRLEAIIQELCSAHAERLPSVSLEAFGSFRSGFANADSDMDLAIVLQDGTSYAACSSLDENDMPRLLEKRLLDLAYGARLLTNTRVPIIKICQSPDETLLAKLRAERQQWDELPVEKKYPHLYPSGLEPSGTEADIPALEDPPAKGAVEPLVSQSEEQSLYKAQNAMEPAAMRQTALGPPGPRDEQPPDIGRLHLSDEHGPNRESVAATESISSTADDALIERNTPSRPVTHKPRVWVRERKKAGLDFPKDGVGIQCDINFFNPLGLHNTQLLRCYSLCDPRVQPVVLLVKSWAKRRKINSSYSGTLSSYGYVLMVLHYLMNVVQPPVLPNLQGAWRPNPNCTPPGATRTEVDGWTVDFWRSESEILNAVRARQMSTNQDSLGALLAGFFDYYSSQSHGPQFRWTTDVLSIRTPGGILSKTEKGWIRAVTEAGDGGKKVQHRYLFCIEDPFELSHNVARTVIHPGIVAIRDEFRRARRILFDVGGGRSPADGQLLDEYINPEPPGDDGQESSGLAASNSVHAPETEVQAAAPEASPPQAGSSHHRSRPKPQKQRAAPASLPKQISRQAPDVTDDTSFPALGPAKQSTSGTPNPPRGERNPARNSAQRAKTDPGDATKRQATNDGA